MSEINMGEIENRFLEQGVVTICGVDEAGRGPLAGPVCVAIAIMPMDTESIIDKINDSKKLTEKTREKLYDEIVSRAIAYHIELIDEKIIDDINILNATKLGMKNCIEKIEIKPDIVLIDAVKIESDLPTDSIIKGDALSYNIACASILAKVTRDRYMLAIDEKYPEYNFKKHKGYGTKEHIENIRKYGPCEIHRRTFLKNI